MLTVQSYLAVKASGRTDQSVSEDRSASSAQKERAELTGFIRTGVALGFA